MLHPILSEVVESYKVFLEVKYPMHYKTYCSRLNSNPQGARAEAIVFSYFRSNFDKVTISEDISTGGADFLVVSGENKFITEVSCIQTESVATQSGMTNDAFESSPGWFGMITHVLRTKVSDKAPQVSGYPTPRVVVITCEHIGSDILIGPRGAESLMGSDTKIRVPIGDESPYKVDLVTDLKDSIFFKFDKNGAVESCRRSISAVLLVSIFSDKSLVVGILHPDPQYPFSISLLRSVPFLRLRKWPPENGVLEMEWVIRSPRAFEFGHREITLRDEELKSI
ncbi:MAG TPA: hypothetical protein ENN18_06335 [Proteobacteria bacterium]|nr:hypothetical protein [Pseudomonadota bacterium]